jgi:lipopolysaccharide biosynthesis glycosyltransferase
VSTYFNAGVLLIDLDRWRHERISERALEFLEKHPTTPYADQDALNVACDGRWKHLDHKWNFQAHDSQRFERTEKRLRPAILHFVMAAKPWDARSASLNAAFYDSFRRRTVFARTYTQALSDRLQRMWSIAKRRLRSFPLLRELSHSHTL